MSAVRTVGSTWQSQRRLMLAIVAVGAAFILFFPARQLVEQRGRIDGLEQRLTELRAENERLSGEVDRLSDPAELEVLARERLGLVKPGERAYFVDVGEPKATPAPEAGDGSPSWWSRTWDGLVSLVRGRG